MSQETLHQREEDALRQHDELKERHERTIEEHERHPEDGTAYHHMKEEKRVTDEKLGFEEKAARDAANTADHELTEEVNTNLMDA